MEWLSAFRIVYFLGAVNALFFSALVFSKKQKTVADKILAWWLIVLSIQVLYPFLYLSNVEKYQQFMGYEACLSVFQPAGLFFYTQAMLGKLRMDRKNIIVVILLVVSAFSVVSFMMALPEDKLHLFNNYDFLEEFSPIDIFFTIIFSVLFVALYAYFLFYSNHLFKKHKKNIQNIYSNSNKVDLLWLKKLIVFFYACYAVMVIISVIISFAGASLVYNDYVFYLMMVVFVFLIGYWGHQQGNVFKLDSTVLDKKSMLSEKENLGEKNGKSFAKEALLLEKLMKEKKPYLEPMLTIHDLAEAINLPAHQLSKLIHKEFSKNFYEFVNGYRIDCFKKMVVAKEYQNFTLLAVALECGFNSKSAFNRIFKEQTGLTPRDYKQKALTQKHEFS